MDPTSRNLEGTAQGGDFAGRIIDLIDGAALALLISIGHRTGLFDLLANRAPSTAADLAESAGLDPKVVVEWMHRMAGAGVLSHDPDSDTYVLPADHAASLCGAASSGNLAALAEFVPLMGAMEDRILECFEVDGRIPYDARPSFRQVISKASDRVVVDTMVNSIVPLVPGLLAALRSGIVALDIGCGSGRAVNLVAANFPKSRFFGYDPIDRHIDRAMTRGFWLGLANVQFRVRDVSEFDEVDRFDLITDFDAIRNRTQAGAALENIVRALRPGGTFLMQQLGSTAGLDETVPLPPDSALETMSTLEQMARRRADGTSSEPLGRKQVRRMLLDAGFETVTVHPSPHNVYNCTFIAMAAG